MKKRGRIWLIVSFVLVLVAWVIWNSRAGPAPALTVKSYGTVDPPTQKDAFDSQMALAYRFISQPDPSIQYAVMELQNISRKPIWILLCSLSSQATATNVTYLQRYSTERDGRLTKAVASISYWGGGGGPIFFSGRRLQPGESYTFKVRLNEKKLEHQAGIAYFAKDFKSTDEFVSYYETIMNGGFPATGPKPSGFKDKLAHWWLMTVSRRNHSFRHEAWCPEILKFPPEKQTNSVN